MRQVSPAALTASTSAVRMAGSGGVARAGSGQGGTRLAAALHAQRPLADSRAVPCAGHVARHPSVTSPRGGCAHIAAHSASRLPPHEAAGRLHPGCRAGSRQVLLLASEHTGTRETGAWRLGWPQLVTDCQHPSSGESARWDLRRRIYYQVPHSRRTNVYR